MKVFTKVHSNQFDRCWHFLSVGLSSAASPRATLQAWLNILSVFLYVYGCGETLYPLSSDETNRKPCLFCVYVCCWLMLMHFRKADLLFTGSHKTGCCPHTTNEINWPKIVFVMLQVQRFGTPCVKKRLDWRENWGWALLKIPTTPWPALFLFLSSLSLLHHKKLKQRQNLTFGLIVCTFCTACVLSWKCKYIQIQCRFIPYAREGGFYSPFN